MKHTPRVKAEVFKFHLKTYKLIASIIHTIPDGVKIGEHDGAHYFTIGQRKGLQIGGKKEPLF